MWGRESLPHFLICVSFGNVWNRARAEMPAALCETVHRRQADGGRIDALKGLGR
jgi:hypothetical protein